VFISKGEGLEGEDLGTSKGNFDEFQPEIRRRRFRKVIFSIFHTICELKKIIAHCSIFGNLFVNYKHGLY
jgi:hypothetical protein